MLFSYILLFWLLLGFSIYLVNKYRRDKKENKRFLDFGEGKWLVLTIAILLASLFVINNLMDDPVFSDKNEQIEYGKKTGQPWLLSEAYKFFMKTDSLNMDAHFNFISANYDPEQAERPNYQDRQTENAWLYGYYYSRSQLSNPVMADIGNWGLGMYYVLKRDYTNARVSFTKVKNRKLKYLNCYEALVHYYFNDTDLAIKCLKKETEYNGYLEGAYKTLAEIYDEEKKYNDLKPIVYEEKATLFIPYSLKQRVYYTSGDWKNYTSALLSHTFSEITPIGFAGAVIILLAWMVYLIKVSRSEQIEWKYILMAWGLGALFVFPVWYLYDTYTFVFSFELSEKPFNDFLYCVFGIGFIEELVKIIPFLLMLRFTKAIKEPIDYIIYASLSALGFAFIENLHYFDKERLDIIHARGFTASISHMINTSIIAYGLILAKFRYKKNAVPYFFMFFFIAMLSHGFYDFWLINKSVDSFSFITFLYLLTSILIYASFINNALNQSERVRANLNINTTRLSGDLAAMLTAVFIFEFICLSFVYGPTIGTREFMSSLFSGGYMILFLSVRLSNIDVLPGEWEPIEFFAGLLPMHILFAGKKLNYNGVVGTKITISAFRQKHAMHQLLPITGEVIKREKISGSSAWFLVKLDKPMLTTKRAHEYVLIAAKEKTVLIEKNKNILVSLVLIPDLEKLQNASKKLKDFSFTDWAMVN